MYIEVVEEVAFRLLKLSMTNAYILYNYWLNLKNCKEITHTKFRITVIKMLLASTVPPQQVQSVPSVTEFARFTGRHFPELIPCNGKQVVCRCQASCLANVLAENLAINVAFVK